jgi:hypothetical protein
MAQIALLTALQPRADLPALPRALLQAGGVSLLERTICLLRARGINDILLLTDPAMDHAASELASMSARYKIKSVARALDLVNELDDDHAVLLIQEGLLLDHQIIDACLHATEEEAITVFPEGTAQFAMASRLDPRHAFAGVLKTQGEALRHICRGLGDWDLLQTMLRAMAAEARLVVVVPSSSLLWQQASAASDEANLLDLVVDNDSHQRGAGPVAKLFAPLSRLVSRLLLPRGVRPWMIRLCAAAMAIVACIAAASGALFAGIILMLLALAVATFSQRISDQLVLPVHALAQHSVVAAAGLLFWLCIAFGLNIADHGAALALLILCASLTSYFRSFFAALTQADLRDGHLIDRLVGHWGYSTVTGLLLALCLLIMDLKTHMLLSLAAFSLVTLVVTLWRFSLRLVRFVAKQSEQIAASIAKSAFRHLLSKTNLTN